MNYNGVKKATAIWIFLNVFTVGVGAAILDGYENQVIQQKLSKRVKKNKLTVNQTSLVECTTDKFDYLLTD